MRVSRISLPTIVVRVEEPTVSIPSQRARRIVLPMIAASTPPVQMPPSFVPQPLAVRAYLTQASRAGSRMSLISLSSATPCSAAAGSPELLLAEEDAERAEAADPGADHARVP